MTAQNEGEPKMMSPQELEAIRERADKATAGPWERIDFPCGQHAEPDVYAGDTEIAMTFELRDGQFIAHARQDIPALLACIEALQIVIDRHEGVLEHYRQENEDLRTALAAVDETAAYKIGSAIIALAGKKEAQP